MSHSSSARKEPARRGKSRAFAGCLFVSAGSLLMVCCLPCIGLGLLDAAKKRAEETALAAEGPPPEPPARKKTDPRPYPVGFRKTAFAYRPADGPERTRKVVLWYPATGKVQPFDYAGLKGFATADAPVAPGAHPVVLFSHGYRGVAAQTIFLMEAFAREGYVVAGVDHADAITEKQLAPFDLGIFFDPKKWNSTTYRDRRDDLVALLDRLLELAGDRESFLHRHIDRKAIGAAGHSLGGYTVMGTIGGWPDWRDERIRAALLLSAYTLPFTQSLGKVETPVMLQGGTMDWGITPFLQAAYDPLPGPKYYLVLEKANHFEWTNFLNGGKTTLDVVRQGNGKQMTDYAVAFFNRHLRGEAAPLLGRKAGGLKSYQFQAERATLTGTRRAGEEPIMTAPAEVDYTVILVFPGFGSERENAETIVESALEWLCTFKDEPGFRFAQPVSAHLEMVQDADEARERIESDDSVALVIVHDLPDDERDDLVRWCEKRDIGACITVDRQRPPRRRKGPWQLVFRSKSAEDLHAHRISCETLTAPVEEDEETEGRVGEVIAVLALGVMQHHWEKNPPTWPRGQG